MIKRDEIITTKYPEWSRKSHSSCPLCLDYSKPKSWNKNNLKMGDVDICALWELAHMKARACALEYE